MIDQVVKAILDPGFLIALLVGIAVFATFFTAMPALSGNQLKARMKSVALERDELRAKQRARLASEADRRRKGLREEDSSGMRSIVERLDLKRALADEGTVAKLRMAGFRGQNPLTRFLFFRLVLPAVGLVIALIYIFLGMFIDGTSMTVLTVPIAVPLIIQAGFDPVWYGVFLIIMIEMSALTPPVGLNLYILQGLTGVDLMRTIKAAVPFFLLLCLGTLLLVIFPQIVLWLPSVL